MIDPLHAGGAATALVLLVLAGVVARDRRGRADRAALERRIERALVRLDVRSLAGHVLICGAGKPAEALVDELARRGVSTVVVERDPARARAARDVLRHVYEGDPRDPETLRQLRGERALGLVVCTPKARERRRVATAARRLNPELLIVATDGAPAPGRVADALLAPRDAPASDL